MIRPAMSESNTPISPDGEIPFFDQPKATPDSIGSSSESILTPSRPGSTYAFDERPTARGNHRVRFGSGEALDALNNRSTFNLRSPNQSPGLSRTPKHPPLAASRFGRIHSQAGYSQSPIDVDRLNLSIQKGEFAQETPLGAYGLGDGDELGMGGNYDQLHESKENLSVKQRAARLSKTGSFSAPSSVQTSPVLSPFNLPSIGASQVQEVVPVDIIPLLDLGEDFEITDTSKKPTARSKTAVTKEASDLVRQHTQRGNKPLRAQADAGDAGAAQPLDQFRGGILGSLLKLYNPPHHEGSRNHPHHGYSNSMASTVVRSPTASGRTTPKWYSKSANTSTTSLGGLLTASGSVLATPAVGKNGRPKGKHWPHYSGVVGAIKTFSGKSSEEEIKVI